MALSYNYKSEAELAFDRNKAQLRHAMRLVTAELMNEALAEMSSQFTAALARGEVLELTSVDEALGYLRAATQKSLGAGSGA